MTLTLVVVAAVLFFAVGARYRRRMMTVVVGVLVAYWLLISPLFSWPATYLLTRFVPPDTGETVDAIVVLARESAIQGKRYDTAIDMMASGRASKLLVMGRMQGHWTFRSLQERNLPADGLVNAVCVRTTNHEAHSAGAILGSQGVDNIILVTDPPHMLRAWLTFKSLGFSVIPHMEPIPDGVASHERTFLALREYFGLISYAALGRFERRPASELPQFAQTVANDFPRDRCFMTADQIRQSLSRS
ncbi:YdcF family protein [Nodosilinea sp. E11]|uniref:YdcF family protein n=1 Tax=Nodosilinea sp. E11 TaxID=3037479 RepID=UPI0029350B7B|nr:YdcF family protein [Nodosilinea sp. E11]WOD41557.1 YdcF family protein [Nodosilinea sp. E11]